MKIAEVVKKLLNRSENVKIVCSAVIAAAGSSTRMDGKNKLFEEVCGIPVLARTLMTFDACDMIDEIIVVTKGEDIPAVFQICRDFDVHKVKQIVAGGATRMESVLIGISEISAESNLIAVHDGARPLITDEIICETVIAASLHNAAAPAVPVTSTVKRAVGNIVTETVDRENLFEVQTPQIFDSDLIKAALNNVNDTHIRVTDDCMAVEAIGASVYLTSGSYENIKITTPIDLTLAEAILTERGLDN